MAPRDSRLLSEQRRRKILDLIDQKGQITVRELAERFSVSAVTARGDLDALCSEELAVRSHGGAVRKLEGGHEYGPTPKKVSRYQDPRRSKVVAPGTGNRTITFVLGNRDTVNEFQSKVLLGAEGYCTRQDWALHFVSFRSDLNAPLSSLSLPEVLTQSKPDSLA